MRTAQVVVNTPSAGNDREFSYIIPQELSFVDVGWRVAVPFGSRTVEGFIVAVADTIASCRSELREIIAPIDNFPLFDPTMLALARWLSSYYLCPLYEALRCFIPGRTGLRWERFFSCTGHQARQDLTSKQREVYSYIASRQEVTASQLRRRFGSGVMRLVALLTARGVIEEKQRTVYRTQGQAKKIIRLNDQMRQVVQNLLGQPARRPAQCRLLAALLQGPGYMALAEAKQLHVSRETINKLVAQGIVTVQEEENTTLSQNFSPGSVALTANVYQRQAVAAIKESLQAGRFHSYLLHGVTGSGKTEVYLQCAKIARSLGKQVIVLVPEIALTSLLVERFTARFGTDVTVVHSRLSEGEKYAAWRQMCLGKAGIVIGARSALFAPMHNVGLIIIDEEHEFSYKQEESPRYHTRIVAKQRALLTNSVLLLGSATPSLETYHLCETGQMTLLRLPQRVMNRPMPAVKVVDLRQEFARGHRGVISGDLAAAIKAALNQRHQVIILLNRRGYATFVLCRECGYILKCPHCDVTMTYHLVGNHLQCHYCGYACAPPTICPSCGGRYIRYFGTGTQKVEEELQRAFPQARIARMDQDTTGGKYAFHHILTDFKRGATDILLGTQMVAKGHDFPNVTVVGVISADTALNLPDFRAAERTFSLLVQAAGRAGRGTESGQVIIQTYNPEHYAIKAVTTYDYQSFYQQEIQQRRTLAYPPFTTLIKITVQDSQEGKAALTAKNLVRELKLSANGAGEQIIGPFAAAVAKVRDIYRWNILVKTTDPARFKELLTAEGYLVRRNIIIDIDPVDVL